MSDPQGRPRPQYGEYASESEQRAHIREPLPEVTPTPLTPPADASVNADRTPGSAAPSGLNAGFGPGARAGAAGAAVDPARAARQTDRIITIALLAFGALNVITTFFSFQDFAAMVDRSYLIMGIDGSFSNFESGKLWGTIASLVLLAGYVGTVIIARGRMKANKTAWWVAIAGAVVTYVIIMACISVPLMSDPAFVDYLVSNQPS